MSKATSSISPEAVHEPVKSTARGRGQWLLRLAAGLALIGFMLWQSDFSSLLTAFKTVSPVILFASVAAYLGGQLISAWKWQLLLRARGVSLPLPECCRLYLVGMFWNLWMPTNIGGDAIRAYLAGPQCGGITAAASSILVERITGFMALVGLAIAALLFDAARQHGANGVAIQIVLATVFVIAFFFAALTYFYRASLKCDFRAPKGKLQKKLVQVTSALTFYAAREHRAILAWVLVLSVLFQSSQIVLNIALAHAIGLAIPASTFWWLIPVLALASLLPLGIGGLGVREAAAVTLLHGSGLLFGDHSSTIIAWSLLWQATVWLSSLPGGFWAVRFGPVERRPLKNEN